MTSPQRKNTIATLTAAAQAVASMPEHERSGWIIYLCESIEAQTPGANINLWLADAIEAMQDRLEAGEW